LVTSPALVPVPVVALGLGLGLALTLGLDAGLGGALATLETSVGRELAASLVVDWQATSGCRARPTTAAPVTAFNILCMLCRCPAHIGRFHEWSYKTVTLCKGDRSHGRWLAGW
jgi:hypothetical protein